MTRIGLELNASVVRGVLGPAGDYPPPLPLEPPGHDLPMVFLLEKSTPELGRAAVSVAREKGHLICKGFLPHIGESGPKAKRWKHGRRTLDADGALALVLQRLQPIGKTAREVNVTLPTYLGKPQAEVLRNLAKKAKLPLVATLSSSMAAALVSYAEQAWVSSAVVLDVDDHAATLAHIRAENGLAQLQETRTFLHLGLQAWKDRIVNAIADACVWQTRRDPRDTPAAEQRIYDQLDGLFEATLQGHVVQIGVQGSNWYQNLLIGPSQTAHFCGQLLASLSGEIERFLRAASQDPDPPVFVLTHAAGRLPGLAHWLRRYQDASAAARPQAPLKPKAAVEDFGEGLLDDSGQALAGTVILSSDALARAAHAFREEWVGHCEDEAPLPLPLPVDAGPARLHFQGQNFYLASGHFILGSQPGCQLWFDSQLHPDVASRHCDIAFDKRAFVLNNRSRDGTLVNDGLVQRSVVLHAGDWIRLGGRGPSVRFLGRTPQHGPKATTAS
jgi:hypothetical protein